MLNRGAAAARGAGPAVIVCVRRFTTSIPATASTTSKGGFPTTKVKGKNKVTDTHRFQSTVAATAPKTSWSEAVTEAEEVGCKIPGMKEGHSLSLHSSRIFSSLAESLQQRTLGFGMQHSTRITQQTSHYERPAAAFTVFPPLLFLFHVVVSQSEREDIWGHPFPSSCFMRLNRCIEQAAHCMLLGTSRLRWKGKKGETECILTVATIVPNYALVLCFT